MSSIICPHCHNVAKKGGYGIVHWLLFICLFPIGLIAIAFRKENACGFCGYKWR